MIKRDDLIAVVRMALWWFLAILMAVGLVGMLVIVVLGVCGLLP